MKKIASILLGLILVVSLTLIGCQSGTQSEAGTIDNVSSKVTESSAIPGEERELQNGDKKSDESKSTSSPVIGLSIASSEEYESPNNNEMAKPNIPQNKNEIETNQSEQTVSELKITAEGVPVEVRLANDGQYSYEYNKDEYTVTTTTHGSTFEIMVTDIRPEIGIGNQTQVIVYIPNQSYTLITSVSTGSSLILPAINANITVTSNASSVIINLPSDYSKTLNYSGNASSCSLSMNKNNDFAVSAKISTSAVSVPNSWPMHDMLSSDYSYTSGNGTAKINIDVTSSSFIFE